MSVIGLILNLLLGALLVGALGLGWRLEQRLKALRQSHQSFTRAVEDLDRAAGRAEQGLSDLRAATDEAAETLASRIERARTLAASLEKLTAEAGRTQERLVAAPAPAATRESILARFAERYGEVKSAPIAAAPAPALRTDLILDDETPRRAATVTRLDRDRFEAPARAAPRSRARIDDDLFDEPPQRLAGVGGAR